jgi:hypothetical protein
MRGYFKIAFEIYFVLIGPAKPSVSAINKTLGFEK